MHGKEDLYMNINLAYELWKDIKIKSLARYDNAAWYKVMPFSNAMWNSGNYFFFILLKMLLEFIKRK